jgi:hypothetical protein
VTAIISANCHTQFDGALEMTSLLTEIAKAMVTAGLVMLSVSFVLNGFLLVRMRVRHHISSPTLLRWLGADEIDPGKNSPNPFQKKWLKLGGGFYGCVGLVTYAVAEYGDIRIIFGYDDLVAFAQSIDISLLIRLFIESIKNFVTAVSWPVYWARAIETDRYWLWIVVAYLGYWAGRKLAMNAVARQVAD